MSHAVCKVYEVLHTQTLDAHLVNSGQEHTFCLQQSHVTMLSTQATPLGDLEFNSLFDKPTYHTTFKSYCTLSLYYTVSLINSLQSIH